MTLWTIRQTSRERDLRQSILRREVLAGLGRCSAWSCCMKLSRDVKDKRSENLGTQVVTPWRKTCSALVKSKGKNASTFARRLQLQCACIAVRPLLCAASDFGHALHTVWADRMIKHADSAVWSGTQPCSNSTTYLCSFSRRRTLSQPR